MSSEAKSNSTADKYTDWTRASSGALKAAMGDVTKDADGNITKYEGNGAFTPAMASAMLSNDASPATREYVATLDKGAQDMLKGLAAIAQPVAGTSVARIGASGGAVRAQQTQQSSQPIQQRDPLPEQIGGIPVGGAVNVSGGRQILLTEQSVDNIRRSQATATGAATAQPAPGTSTTAVYGRDGKPLVDYSGRTLEVPHTQTPQQDQTTSPNNA